MPAAKKAPAKKATTKKVAAKKAPAKPVEKDNDEVEVVSEEESKEDDKLSLDELVKEVLAGKWGEGQYRRVLLSQAGYNHNEVQKEIIRLKNSR